MPTLSPGENPDTAEPMAATSPTTSWPGTTPTRCTGRSPSVTCRSVRHTPQASTRTSSSSDAGAGTGSSAGCSGRPVTGPGSTTRQACIVRGAVVIALISFASFLG